MGLRLIYGRAGSGKSHLCLNDIKEKLEDNSDRPLILLVPEQFSLQAERNLVEVVGTGGIIRADVLTFRRMAHRIFNEVGGITRSHINSAGKCMILYKIIDALKENLKIYKKAAKQPGFVNNMADLIAEFKRYNVLPENLKEATSALDDGNLLKDKVNDLAAIYERFNDTLHERYMDSDDELTLLAQKLPVSKQFKDAEIWIDEFSGFTPQEYKVIENLMLIAGQVNITLCTDCIESECDLDGSDVFSPSRYAAKKLMGIAQSNNIIVDKPVNPSHNLKVMPRFTESCELAHLERNFYAFPYNVYKEKTKELSIFSAANIFSEVEETARDIIRLVRDEGLRYRDITVVTRDLDVYRKIAAAIFTQYGIPNFIDTKRNLNSHPLVMLVNSVLDIFNSNWSYESVFRYVKTGLTNIKAEDADLLENYVLEWGIRCNRWTGEKDWDFTAIRGEKTELPESEKERLSNVNRIRNELTQPLVRFYRKTRGKKSAIEFCTAIYEFLYEIDVPDRIEKMVVEFKNNGQLDMANEYRQVWNITMGVFDQIAEVMGYEAAALQQFARILSIGFGEYKTGLIPPALDQVMVGSIERSKSHEVKALYILGVNDGVFPSTAGQEGVLSDSDRGILKSSGVELAQDTKTRAFEEQFLVYRALSTPGKSLRLSYPVANHEGRTMRPSTIISRVKKIFPCALELSNIIETDSDDESIAKIAAPGPGFNQVITAVRKYGEGNNINPVWWDVYKWYIAKEEWSKKVSTALSGLIYTNQSGRVGKAKIHKLYGSPAYSSVSRMEKYASCPFSYFVQYGLKAKERKIFKLSAPDMGTFMHEVLDEFALKLDRENLSWRTCNRDWCSDAVSEIVDNLLLNMGSSILNSSRRYKYLAQRLKRVLTRAVWLIAEHIRRSGFEPVGYELGFGDNERFPAITIELPTGEQVKLTGRIDRLDAMKTEEGTFLRIVDYKSGNKAFRLSDIYYGLQVQLITYLDAIWENKNNEFTQPVMPGGILYFRIDDPVVKSGSSQISEDDIEKAIMKQLKMKGLLLADVKLVKEMDRTIDGDSLIIPARINKGDVLGRSSAATEAQFQKLRNYVRRLLTKISQEILEGNVEINPYRKSRVTSCQYCSFLSVCQFDRALKDNKYKVLKDFKDDEAWEKFEGGE